MIGSMIFSLGPLSSQVSFLLRNNGRFHLTALESSLTGFKKTLPPPTPHITLLLFQPTQLASYTLSIFTQSSCVILYSSLCVCVCALHVEVLGMCKGTRQQLCGPHGLLLLKRLEYYYPLVSCEVFFSIFY